MTLQAWVWRCFQCGRHVRCNTDGEPQDWVHDGRADMIGLSKAVCEDWPACGGQKLDDGLEPG